MLKYKYLIFLLIGLTFSCKEEAKTENTNNDTPTPEKSYFVSATLTNEFTAADLKSLTAAFGQKELTDKILYDVASYKMIYETTYKGNPIKASGLIFIPKGLNKEAPLLSLQHGTTSVKDEAPSVSGEVTGVELLASTGYISILPDFIGYGTSASIFHPYYDQKHSALAVIDMVKSTKEFLSKQKIMYSDKLFLTGYSEGGYVTLAAAKEIENDSLHNLKVTAMAAGAGGYDLTEMLNGVVKGKEYSYPSYAFVLASYINTYDWDKSFDYFFQDKYAKALDTLMNGDYDGGFINSKLTTNVGELLDVDFYNNLQTEEGEKELKKALADNSVSGWKSDIPIRLYHGTKDNIIPYQNSQLTLDKFKSYGTTNIDLILIPEGGHGSSFIPMLKSFIPWFEEYK